MWIPIFIGLRWKEPYLRELMAQQSACADAHGHTCAMRREMERVPLTARCHVTRHRTTLRAALDTAGSVSCRRSTMLQLSL